MSTYDISPLFRYSVGFDRMQRLVDAAMERSETAPGYPPYNIETLNEDTYRITMAVAGFSEGDLDITAKENSLTVSGNLGGANDEAAYLHRGIATRTFERRFDLADHVKAVGANLENGMLYIDLERQVPEALKPRKIDIKTGPVAMIAKKAKKLMGVEKAA